MGAQRFQIHVEPPVLDDLQHRLRHARWTDVAGHPGGGWGLGTDPTCLRTLVAYWREAYDWRRHEAQLNALPQFTAQVGAPGGGARLHFVHALGRGPQAMPLLLLHGWPDSFYRFHKVIPLLCGANAGGPGPTFDLVVPSLPGFGFTGPVRGAGGPQPSRHSAQLLWQLMTEVLGYERFAVAGGDGGSVLAQILAIDHPESVSGIHLTDLGWHATQVDPTGLPAAEQAYLEAAKQHAMADGAYVMAQATRPRSLAVALNDSPVALASWIVDRFHAGSDAHGNIENSVSKDELLTLVTTTWATQSIGTSFMPYHDMTDAGAARWMLEKAKAWVGSSEVPAGFALFPKDLTHPPREWAARFFNVQHWAEMPRGGHFAALEEPELLARDIRAFFRPLRP